MQVSGAVMALQTFGRGVSVPLHAHDGRDGEHARNVREGSYGSTRGSVMQTKPQGFSRVGHPPIRLKKCQKTVILPLLLLNACLGKCIRPGRRLHDAGSGISMEVFQRKNYLFIAIWIVIIQSIGLTAEQIPVRHIEGVTLGFLVLRNSDGEALAYGDWKQVVKADGLVVDDLRFRFKDGSFYEEITKFTQRGRFRLVSDEVEQKGPSFKQESQSWIDVRTGTITVRTSENGEEKTTTNHLDLPDDTANGLLFVLLKNVDPSALETTVSFVAASTKPRVVKWNISPGQEKTVKVGLIEHKAQHYVVKTKIEGAAGAIAPLVGKQPPDIHVWLVKSEAPTFLEFEGPLSQDNPVWRIELTAPEPDSQDVR